jgi:hypothetical protein
VSGTSGAVDMYRVAVSGGKAPEPFTKLISVRVSASGPPAGLGTKNECEKRRNANVTRSYSTPSPPVDWPNDVACRLLLSSHRARMRDDVVNELITSGLAIVVPLATH